VYLYQFLKAINFSSTIC